MTLEDNPRPPRRRRITQERPRAIRGPGRLVLLTQPEGAGDLGELSPELTFQLRAMEARAADVATDLVHGDVMPAMTATAAALGAALLGDDPMAIQWQAAALGGRSLRLATEIVQLAQLAPTAPSLAPFLPPITRWPRLMPHARIAGALGRLADVWVPYMLAGTRQGAPEAAHAALSLAAVSAWVAMGWGWTR